MNCKPDQLCRVVSAGPDNQALVQTLKQCCMSSPELPMWKTETLQHINTGRGMSYPPGYELCYPDAYLRPLGDEGPEDLTVSDELKKFADKETRKVIPLVWNPEGEKV